LKNLEKKEKEEKKVKDDEEVGDSASSSPADAGAALGVPPSLPLLYPHRR
jgi:hypothetical protein